MYVAFGAVALVLLIACANVANLLLARGAARGKELAVRAALGASRGRLIQQLLVESFVLCLAGGLAGVALAGLLIRVAAPVLSDSIPFTAAVSIDLRVLLFAGAVVAAVSLLAGAFPAVRASLHHVAASLNRSSRGASTAHASVRRAIVAAEVALSLVLLSGALLLLRSLLKLQAVDTGVRVENVLSMSLDLPPAAYRTPQQAALFYRATVERLRAAPGVADAGLATALPLRWIGNGEGLKAPGVEKLVRIRFKRVDSGYFATMGIPVLSGRGIAGQDRQGAPRVAVVNEALATRLAEVAGIRNPIGKTFHVSSPGYEREGGSMPQVEIVGVIQNERVAPPGRPTPPVVYVPLAQAPSTGIKLVVRSQIGTANLMPAVRDAIREVDPSLPIGDVATMEQVLQRTLMGASRPAWLIGVFALVAAVLTGIGLYGVVSYSVTQRRREIGIRMALGARASSVVAQVLRNALAMVAMGLAFGMLGAVALTRVVNSLLFEVSPLDAPALTLACAAMIAVGVVAAFVPAARAARVHPIAVLREEG
jgi:putative ABC transport system permease protein